MLHKDKITEKELERVTREIRILQLLRHPNIVQLYEVLDTPGHIYLVMEYATGGELFDYIVTHGKVKESKALKFFLEMLSAVHYCHCNSIIHRDLKPENLLLDDKSHIKIIDFGFANTFQDGALLNTFCGSPAYAPPEMVVGEAYDGKRVDIWSMGVILYALIAGYLPFDDENVSALYRKVMAGKYKCPRSMSPPIRDLIARMLVVDPSKRITIEGIMQHPWIVENASTAMRAGVLASSPLDRLAGEPDPELIALCDSFGFPEPELRAGLTEGMRNQATTTYFLLAQRKKASPADFRAMVAATNGAATSEASDVVPMLRVRKTTVTTPSSPLASPHKSHRPRVSSPLASTMSKAAAAAAAATSAAGGRHPRASPRSGGTRKRSSTVSSSSRSRVVSPRSPTSPSSSTTSPLSPLSPTSPTTPTSPKKKSSRSRHRSRQRAGTGELSPSGSSPARSLAAKVNARRARQAAPAPELASSLARNSASPAISSG